MGKNRCKSYLGTLDLKFKFPSLAVYKAPRHQVAIFSVPIISQEFHPFGTMCSMLFARGC